MDNAILVTGTTGFVGSHFLLWLATHRPSRVFALVRGQSATQRATKLTAALASASQGYRPAPDWDKVAADTQIVPGDIELPSCGVSSADVATLFESRVRELWHFAATLSFEEKRRELIRTQNIGGPRHAIELAARIGAERFVYVSTAYTAGAESGRFDETLHSQDRRFSNAYEESKCEAEHVVTRLCAERGLALTILRPSIVIGSSRTHMPSGTTAGLYGFIREIGRLRRRLERTDEPVRIQAVPNVLLNFVPVDLVMRDIMTVIDRDFDVAPIVHLSAESGISVATLVSSIAEQLGLESLDVGMDPADALSPLERVLANRITFYGSYLRSEKEFVRSLESRWVIDEEAFHAYVARGIDALGSRARPRAERRKLTAR